MPPLDMRVQNIRNGTAISNGKSFFFQLQIEIAAGREGFKELGNLGDFLAVSEIKAPQVFEERFCNLCHGAGHPAGRRVVNDHIVSVRRFLYVALHPIGPTVDSLLESEQRVLGIPGAESPMA